jgi:hypothetical protein
MYRLFDGPPRGIVQLIAAILLSLLYFFGTPGRGYSRRPSFFEEFQSGNPSDFAVLFGFALLVWIGFSVAVTIMDYRSSGRLW